MKFLLVVIFFTYCFMGLSASFEYQFVNYGVNEGLPSAQVYEIIQDTKGYIWFGTDRGLVRYNGYDFKVYTVKDGLSTNVIFKLDLDEKGRLCCYGRDRKIYIMEDDHFVPFKFNAEFKALHTTRSNLIGFDFNADGLVFESLDFTGVIASNGIASRGVLKNNGEREMDYGSGIHISTDGDGSIGVLNGVDCDSIFIDGEFRSLSVGSLGRSGYADVARFEGLYYFSYSGDLYSFSGSNLDSIKLVHQFSTEILDLKFDEVGNLYLGLDRGEGLWKMTERDLSQLQCILPEKSVSNVLIDDSDGVWAATLFSGLFYCRDEGIKSLIIDNNDLITGLMNYENVIYACTEEDKLLRIAVSDSSLSVSEPYEKFINRSLDDIIAHNENLGVELAPISVVINHSDNTYRSSQFFTKDYLTTDDHLFIVSRTNISAYTRNPYLGNYINYDFDQLLYCAVAYEDETLLLSTVEGLVYFKPEYELLGNDIQSRLYYEVENLKPYRPERPFFKFKIREMLNVKDSLYVFGSAEQGLYIERPGQPDLWLGKKDGLISNDIDRLYINDDKLVVITKAGISVISEAKGIKNYTVKNGLLSNNVRDVIIRNEKLWVATDKGVSVFGANWKTNLDFPIYLTSLKKNQKSETIREMYEMDYKTDLLDVSFEGVSFEQEGKINYKYQLKGVDKSWVETTNTTARYANLPYGHFEFWVIAQKGDLSWTEPVLLFNIDRIRPFWETKWFYAVLEIMVLLLIWFAYNKRFNRLKQKQEDQFLLLNMERKTLQAQMNPHFVFNSLTSLQSLILDDKKVESQEYLAKFSKLTRLALNQSTQNVITLKEELDLLGLYIGLECIRYDYKFEFELICDVNPLAFEIPPMLIQPFVENAIKHGLASQSANGKLIVEFKKRDEATLLCLVSDNGVGRSATRKSDSNKSLGIQLISKRLAIILKKHNGNAVEIEDLYENGVAAGTLVKIIVPLIVK